MTKPSRRGGARPGAGRPRLNRDHRLIKLGVALTPAQDAYVNALAIRFSVTQSEAIRMLVEEARARRREGRAPMTTPRKP